MTVYRSYSARWAREWRDDGFHFLPYEVSSDSGLEDLAEWTRELIEPIVEHLDLIIQGVDVASYRRFLSLVPRSTLTLANIISSSKHRSSVVPLEEDVQFCIDFVVDSALRMRDNRLRGNADRFRHKNVQLGVVERDCDVIVYPGDDRPEILRGVSEGDRLSVVSGSVGRYPGYIGVLQDDEIYYLRSGHIRIEPYDADRVEVRNPGTDGN